MTDQFEAMQKAWQAAPAEPFALDLAQLQKKAASFEGKVRDRNLRELAAAAVVIAVFGGYFMAFQDLHVRVGCALIILGTLFVVGVLYVQGREGEASAADRAEACLAAHRRILERQRDLLAGVWLWYLLPLVPGMAVFTFAIHPGDGIPWLHLSLNGLVFVGIGWFNANSVRRLQQELDSLPLSIQIHSAP